MASHQGSQPTETPHIPSVTRRGRQVRTPRRFDATFDGYELVSAVPEPPKPASWSRKSTESFPDRSESLLARSRPQPTETSPRETTDEPSPSIQKRASKRARKPDKTLQQPAAQSSGSQISKANERSGQVQKTLKRTLVGLVPVAPSGLSEPEYTTPWLLSASRKRQNGTVTQAFSVRETSDLPTSEEPLQSAASIENPLFPRDCYPAGTLFAPTTPDHLVRTESNTSDSPTTGKGRGRHKKKETKRDSDFKMPAATSVKRVKNHIISRPFIIGSEAWPLDETNSRRPDTPAEHTKGWRVYVRTPTGAPPIEAWLKKVSFKIFHTYENSTRMVDSPPFEIHETGWGGFNVDVRLYFVPEAAAKPEYRTHFLQLEPYGDEATMKRQTEEKVVRSEFLDYIEFGEPPEALWDILTSEEQFEAPAKARAAGAAARGENPVSAGGKGGKGKGRSRGISGAGAEAAFAGSGSCELPEHSTDTNPFSRDTERLIIDQIQDAMKKVDEMSRVEERKKEDVLAKLAKLQERHRKREGAIAKMDTGEIDLEGAKREFEGIDGPGEANAAGNGEDGGV